MKEAFSKAHRAVVEDHLRLETLLGQICDTQDLASLVALLQSLDTMLVAHFAHEEQPGGIYDLMKAASPEYGTPAGDLLNEHYDLRAATRELADRGRRLLEASHHDVREDARRLVEQVVQHEAREDELARRVLESGATGGQTQAAGGARQAAGGIPA